MAAPLVVRRRGRALVHAGAVAVEVVPDVEPRRERADRVDPRLLVGDAADVRFREIPAHRAPVAVGGRVVRDVGRRPREALRVAQPVLVDPVDRGVAAAAVRALRAHALVDVAFGVVRPEAVLDPHHRLGERGRCERPARLAPVLVAHARDPRPSPAVAPINRRARRVGDRGRLERPEILLRRDRRNVRMNRRLRRDQELVRDGALDEERVDRRSLEDPLEVDRLRLGGRRQPRLGAADPVDRDPRGVLELLGDLPVELLVGQRLAQVAGLHCLLFGHIGLLSPGEAASTSGTGRRRHSAAIPTRADAIPSPPGIQVHRKPCR